MNFFRILAKMRPLNNLRILFVNFLFFSKLTGTANAS